MYIVCQVLFNPFAVFIVTVNFHSRYIHHPAQMVNNTKCYIHCGEESCVTGSDLPSMHCPWLLQLLAQRMLSRMSRGGWMTVVPFTLTVVHSSRLNSMLVMHICSKFLKADSAHEVTPVIWNSYTWIPEGSGMQGVKHHIHLQLKVQWQPSLRTNMIQTKVLKESWSWVRNSVAWKYYHHDPKKNIKNKRRKDFEKKKGEVLTLTSYWTFYINNSQLYLMCWTIWFDTFCHP